MDFFSLELSDTNIIDHNTYDYSPQYISFEIVDKWKIKKKGDFLVICKVALKKVKIES